MEDYSPLLLSLTQTVVEQQKEIDRHQKEIDELRSYINAVLIVGYSPDICELNPMLKETKNKTKKYIIKTGSRLLDKVSNENFKVPENNLMPRDV